VLTQAIINLCEPIEIGSLPNHEWIEPPTIKQGFFARGYDYQKPEWRRLSAELVLSCYSVSFAEKLAVNYIDKMIVLINQEITRFSRQYQELAKVTIPPDLLQHYIGVRDEIDHVTSSCFQKEGGQSLP
jgi:hypothetical protein